MNRNRHSGANTAIQRSPRVQTRLDKPKSARPRGRPSPEDAAAIEEELLDIALQLFLEKGYGGTAMRQIVHAAGISKTTLYSRFPSKADLFRAIVLQQIDRLAPPSSLSAESGMAGLEQGLCAYANHMLKLSLQGDVLGINRLIYSEAHRFPELGVAAAERTERGIRRVARFIRDCSEASGQSCTDATGAAEAFIFMVRGWYVHVILTNQQISDAVREQWVNRAVRALISAPNRW